MSDAVSFWERRRAAVKAEEEAEARAAAEVEQASALDGKSDEEILEHFGLPEPSSMTQGDDFSGFMAKGVPEHLRKIALRTLWRSNPVLANLDGLNEYDEDYRAAMLLSEPIKTAYQVGKGMKAHLDEMARKADALAESLEVDDKMATGGEEEIVVEDAPDSFITEQPERVSGSVTASDVRDGIEVEIADLDEIAPLPRRMRFRFEETTA